MSLGGHDGSAGYRSCQVIMLCQGASGDKARLFVLNNLLAMN